jgi:hypothetical protein
MNEEERRNEENEEEMRRMRIQWAITTQEHMPLLPQTHRYIYMYDKMVEHPLLRRILNQRSYTPTSMIYIYIC